MHVASSKSSVYRKSHSIERYPFMTPSNYAGDPTKFLVLDKFKKNYIKLNKVHFESMIYRSKSAEKI